MKEKVLGVAAAAVIITSALHVSTYVRPDGVLSFLSASARDSQQKVTTAETRELTAQELYAIIQHLNKQIEASVLSSESNAKSQGGSGSAGGSSSNMMPADAGDGSGGDSGEGSGSGSGSTGGTSGQNNSAPVQDVEAKVIGATGVVTRVDKITTNIAADNEIGQASASLERLLVQRKNFMMMLAKVEPRLFFMLGLSKEALVKIPAELKSEVETSVILTGEITVFQGEDFEHPENSRIFYSLRVDDEKYSLSLINAPEMRSGRVFRVEGVRIGSTVVANSSDIQETANNQLGARPDASLPQNPDYILTETMGTQRLLVVPLHFVDDLPSPPVDRAVLYDRIFNGQFQNYYREQSYNQISFAGQVMDWTIVHGPCRMLTTGEVIEILVAQGINLTNFDRVIFTINAYGNNCFGGYSGGVSTIGKESIFFNGVWHRVSMAWVKTVPALMSQSTQHPNWFTFDYLLSHEMGHSLGLLHSSGLDCGTEILSDSCVSVEYGNQFDVMGDGRISLHFNAFAKVQLGWIHYNKILFINNSGRYTLNPLESSTSATQLAWVRAGNSFLRPFTLELRKGIGFDGTLNHPLYEVNQNGLFVNMYRSLLDMSPTWQEWTYDSNRPTLNGQTVFTDQTTGVTIGPIVSVDSNSITFDVNINNTSPCIRTSPNLNVVQDDAYTVIGAGDVVFAYFMNPDSESCEESMFNLEVPMPASWNYSVEPAGDVVLASQGHPYWQIAGSKVIEYEVPEETSPGAQFNFGLTFENLDSGLSTSRTFDVTAVQGPIVSEIVPSAGEVGVPVIIRGSHFDGPNNNLRVLVVGEFGFRFLGDLNHTDSSINFSFPQTICEWGGSVCEEINTPAGEYDIEVISYGASDGVSFEVVP